MTDPIGVNEALADSHAAAAESPSATDVTDVVLLAALEQGGTSVLVEPSREEGIADAHTVRIEGGGEEIASALLVGGLGDAVIARLALVADLDISSGRVQTGRTQVSSGGDPVDLFVTIRATAEGLSAEVRLVDDRRTSQSQPAIALPAMLEPGTEIDQYVISGVLGRGGMGIVYRGEHKLLGRQFAVKVLRRRLMQEDPDAVARFMREARAAARVRHPGIVDVSDVNTLPDGRPYLVMEILDGIEVGQLVESHGPFAPARAVALTRQVARALGAAHEAGVVHRDMSSSNVFLTRGDDGEVAKVVDFGAAHLLRAPKHEEVPDGPPGIVLGTPWYMAPEQARGYPCDERTDLYSLGVVLYEMLAGRVPFDDENVREIVRMHVLTPAPAVSSPLEPLPELLEKVVARLLRKDADERYQTAAALVEDLDKVERLMGRSGWRKWLPA